MGEMREITTIPWKRSRISPWKLENFFLENSQKVLQIFSQFPKPPKNMLYYKIANNVVAVRKYMMLLKYMQ
jgi:hypothetical protein